MTNRVQGSALHYFAEGNTARGSVSLFDSSLQNLDRIYILKGSPGSGKSTLIQRIARTWRDRGYEVWLLHCARDHTSLDGVIIPQLKAGIVDGTPPHVIEPRLPGAVEEYIHLSEAWDAHFLRRQRDELKRIQDQIDRCYAEAYAGFAEALHVHDEWEAIYIEHMDFAAADRLTERYIELLFADKKREGGLSRVDHRFLGAATPVGAVDYVPSLTQGLLRRYFIKGRPGSGKSTMLKRIAKEAGERGFDVEVYHCGFDPSSVDMIIVRELGFAVFDSTQPHEYHPERSGDTIIDMYTSCIKPGTDERYAQRLQDIESRYRAKMKYSTQLLAEANRLHRKLETIYGQAMDFSLVNQIREQIEEQMQELAVSL